MVPFADCLNHANVQTKYDFNVNDNCHFRLFPTGKNMYSKGSEVFNSYGRRPNDNLLLDYGFSMLDNEWDQVLVDFTFSSTDDVSNYEEKITFLYNSGNAYHNIYNTAIYVYYYHQVILKISKLKYLVIMISLLKHYVAYALYA
jgi:hypothetical protein